jgi:hypothetical protein
MAQELAVHEAKTWSWGDFLRGPWNLIAVPLALIVLVNLTGRLIEWVPLIDWVSEKYATWMIPLQDKMVGTTLTTTSAFAAASPKEVSGYCRAMTKGLVFTMTNKAAGVKIL